jgi:hypothetical protein
MVHTVKFFKTLEQREKTRSLLDFLLYAASPVVKRSKPAVLLNITLKNRTANDWHNAKTTLYETAGLSVKTLRRCENNFRVLVYDAELLSQALNQPYTQSILLKMRYHGGVEDMLGTLSARYLKEKCPHEIGLFLGYPPEDVEGFILHNGADFLLCGAWKVYSDVNYAKRKWREWYDAKERMAELLTNGVPCQTAVNTVSHL